MGWKATGQPTVRKQRDKWVVRVDGIDTTTGKHRPRQLGTYSSQRSANAAARSVRADERSTERGTASWLVRRHVASRTDITAKAQQQYEWAIPHIENGLGAIPIATAGSTVRTRSLAATRTGRATRPLRAGVQTPRTRAIGRTGDDGFDSPLRRPDRRFDHDKVGTGGDARRSGTGRTVTRAVSATAAGSRISVRVGRAHPCRSGAGGTAVGPGDYELLKQCLGPPECAGGVRSGRPWRPPISSALGRRRTRRGGRARPHLVWRPWGSVRGWIQRFAGLGAVSKSLAMWVICNSSVPP